MTLDQLRIFLAVAGEGHVTRAARALNLTQSAVSAADSALETRHGVRLFDRVGRGIVLTDEGQAFVPTARALLAQGMTVIPSSTKRENLAANLAALKVKLSPEEMAQIATLERGERIPEIAGLSGAAGGGGLGVEVDDDFLPAQ